MDANELAQNPPKTKIELLAILQEKVDECPQYRKYVETAKLARITKGQQKNGTCWYTKGDLCLVWPTRQSAYSWRPVWPTHKLDGTPRRLALPVPDSLKGSIGMTHTEPNHYIFLD